MMEHDVIYLQTGKDEADLWEEGVTWCRDEINDGDTKYLLATSEREAAPVLLETLEKIANYPEPDDYDRVGWIVAMEDMKQLAAAAIDPPDSDVNKE